MKCNTTTQTTTDWSDSKENQNRRIRMHFTVRQVGIKVWGFGLDCCYFWDKKKKRKGILQKLNKSNKENRIKYTKQLEINFSCFLEKIRTRTRVFKIKYFALNLNNVALYN